MVGPKSEPGYSCSRAHALQWFLFLKAAFLERNFGGLTFVSLLKYNINLPPWLHPTQCKGIKYWSNSCPSCLPFSSTEGEALNFNSS